MGETGAAKKETTQKSQAPAVQKKGDIAVSEQFTKMIIREFTQAVGDVSLTPYQKRLAQHLFIKIDTSLRELEAKRTDKNRAPIIWANINMNRLALDAVHRVELGLDALIPGHVYPIPYWNTSQGKYDLDLRIGYVGKDLYKRRMAVEPPVDVIYHLVYKNDAFRPVMKSAKNPVESYEFEIKEPFNRGDVIGGFAYMVYEDPTKNRLVMVTDNDFSKAKAKAKSEDFWRDWPDEMKYKTVVNRATKYLTVDPEKVNAAYLAVERQEEIIDVTEARAEKEEKGNTGPVLGIEASANPENGAGATQEENKPQGEAQPPEKEKGQPQGRGPGF